MDPLEKTVTAGAGRGVALKGRNEVKGGDGLTPATAKTSSSGGEWVDVSGGGSSKKMAANTRPHGGNEEVEEAAGFSEATSRFLAQGGLRTGGKYTEGRLKGMTQDQAVEKAKQMWDSASPSIREKYAARVRNRPAMSERKQPAEEQFQQAGKKPMAAFSPKQREGAMDAFSSGVQDIGDENSLDQEIY